MPAKKCSPSIPALIRVPAIAAVLAFGLFANASAFADPPHPLDPVKLKYTLIEKKKKDSPITKFNVTEVDGTRVKGMLIAVRDDNFVILPKGARQPLTIPYSQVSVVSDGHPKAHRVLSTVEEVALAPVAIPLFLALMLTGHLA